MFYSSDSSSSSSDCYHDHYDGGYIVTPAFGPTYGYVEHNHGFAEGFAGGLIGGVIGGAVAGAVGAHVGRRSGPDVVVVQQPPPPPPPAYNQGGKNVHVHVNKYIPPNRAENASANMDDKPSKPKQSKGKGSSPSGPAMEQMNSGLEALERLMQSNNVSAGNIQAPAFKKWYLQEREKFTDMDLLGIYDARMLSIDVWLRDAQNSVPARKVHAYPGL